MPAFVWVGVFVVCFAFICVFHERSKKCLLLIFCLLLKKAKSCLKKNISSYNYKQFIIKEKNFHPTAWVEIELSALTSSATLMSLAIRIFIPTVPTISKTPCAACVKIHKNIPASRFHNCIQNGITAVSKMHLIGWHSYPNDDFVVEFVEQWFHWYNNLKTYTAKL